MLEEWESLGRTAVIVERDGVLAGALALADTVKPEARDAIAGLRRMGIEVELLTGDNARAARAVADAVGIDKVQAEVTPAGKLEEISRLQADGRRVGMVGDGVNDAAALARADLGIAMGTGVGAAIEAADITVLSGDLRGVARALRLARETYTIILQNLSWAFGYNLIAIPLAMTGLLSPALAAVAMGVSSITVVTNSLRLRRFGRPGRPTPVRSSAQRRRGITVASLVPAALLGALVLAVPNTFAVPSTVSATIREGQGAVLQLDAEPQSPGSTSEVVHLYLFPTSVSFRSVAVSAVSDKGAHVNGAIYYVAGYHEYGYLKLSPGVWKLTITGRDSAGHRLHGVLTVPVN
jgi:soluble P-type ATPase